jgi:hypothetical protein
VSGRTDPPGPPHADGELAVAAHLDQDDLWRFQRYVMLHEPMLRRRLAIPLAVGTVLAFGVLLVLTDLSLPVTVAVAVATSPATAAVVWLRVRRRFMRALAESPGLMGRRTIIADRRKLREHSARGARAVRWEDVHDLREDRHNLYVLFSRTSGYPVPKRVFDDPEMLGRFRRTLRERIDQAGSGD